MGQVATSTEALLCTPVITNAQMGVNYSVDGTLLDPDATAYPCGLIAKSNFTDNFTLSTTSFDNPTIVAFDESQIAWKSDIAKFKNQPGDWQSI